MRESGRAARSRAPAYRAITASALIALYAGARDRAARPLSRITSALYYFYFVNLAGALGIWDEWRGVRHVTWDHIRKQQS